jgi:hypothetical protein
MRMEILILRGLLYVHYSPLGFANDQRREAYEEVPQLRPDQNQY